MTTPLEGSISRVGVHDSMATIVWVSCSPKDGDVDKTVMLAGILDNCRLK